MTETPRSSQSAQEALSGRAVRLLAFLRNPFHYLVLPLVVYFSLYPSLVLELARNGTWTSSFNYSSAVFPVTYTTALILFVATVWLSSRRIGLVHSLFYSVSLDFGAVGLFELVFDEFFPNTAYAFKLGMFCFVLFGCVSFTRWKFSWLELSAVIVWISLFFGWVFLAPSIPTSRGDTVPFLFNALTKLAAFVVFFLPFLTGVLGWRVPDPREIWGMMRHRSVRGHPR